MYWGGWRVEIYGCRNGVQVMMGGWAVVGLMM
jgi:hypothetical protein